MCQDQERISEFWRRNMSRVDTKVNFLFYTDFNAGISTFSGYLGKIQKGFVLLNNDKLYVEDLLWVAFINPIGCKWKISPHGKLPRSSYSLVQSRVTSYITIQPWPESYQKKKNLPSQSEFMATGILGVRVILCKHYMRWGRTSDVPRYTLTIALRLMCLLSPSTNQTTLLLLISHPITLL